MRCRLPMRIGGGPGGGSGGGTSEYAVTISDSTGELGNLISMANISIVVDKTTISNTGTYTAASGSVLNINVLVSGAPWEIYVNGTRVKQSSEAGSYSHDITSNAQLQVGWGSTGSTLRLTITTEQR